MNSHIRKQLCRLLLIKSNVQYENLIGLETLNLNLIFLRNLNLFIYFILIIFPIHYSGAQTFDNGFGINSGCSENVVCYEDEWCNQIRSVCLIATLNDQGIYESRATGSLIVNERHDGRPYVLLAGHSVNFNNPNAREIDDEELTALSQMAFIFNFQAVNCNPETPPYQAGLDADFVIGATLVAFLENGQGEFALVELNERPPIDYKVYYNGYYAKKERPERGSFIHHPRTDLKKISFYDKQPRRYTGKKWELELSQGHMEGGSSGAPMLNQNNRVVGIQSQGPPILTNCDPNQSYYATRLEVAWDNIPNQFHQLKRNLNPHASSLEMLGLSGFEPCKQGYYFQNANDLHTSINVNGMLNPSSIGSRSYDGQYFSSGTIQTSSNVTITNNTSVHFRANNILLGAGFKTENGVSFIAESSPCNSPCNDVRSELEFLIAERDLTVYEEAPDEPIDPHSPDLRSKEKEQPSIIEHQFTKWIYLPSTKQIEIYNTIKNASYKIVQVSTGNVMIHDKMNLNKNLISVRNLPSGLYILLIEGLKKPTKFYIH